MKLTKEVNYQVQIRAILTDEGEFKLILSARAPYGNRTAGVTIEDFSDEVKAKVIAVLERVMKQEADRIVVLADNAAAQARMVAANLGEQI